MTDIKQLSKQVEQARDQIESRILGRKGKVRAKQEARDIFESLDLRASEGVRDSYTVYYVSNQIHPGSISIFIHYNSKGIVTKVYSY